MFKLAAISPLIQTTAEDVPERGDEVHPPMMSNPYVADPAQGPEYENGYQHAQELGHLQLVSVPPDQLPGWRNSAVAWRQGFAASARALGAGQVANTIEATVKTAGTPIMLQMTKLAYGYMKGLRYGAGIGAGLGAVKGLVSGEDMGDVARNTLQGAAVGGVLGMATKPMGNALHASWKAKPPAATPPAAPTLASKAHPRAPLLPQQGVNTPVTKITLPPKPGTGQLPLPPLASPAAGAGNPAAPGASPPPPRGPVGPQAGAGKPAAPLPNVAPVVPWNQLAPGVLNSHKAHAAAHLKATNPAYTTLPTPQRQALFDARLAKMEAAHNAGWDPTKVAKVAWDFEKSAGVIPKAALRAAVAPTNTKDTPVTKIAWNFDKIAQGIAPGNLGAAFTSAATKPARKNIVPVAAKRDPRQHPTIVHPPSLERTHDLDTPGMLQTVRLKVAWDGKVAGLRDSLGQIGRPVLGAGLGAVAGGLGFPAYEEHMADVPTDVPPASPLTANMGPTPDAPGSPSLGNRFDMQKLLMTPRELGVGGVMPEVLPDVVPAAPAALPHHAVLPQSMLAEQPPGFSYPAGAAATGAAGGAALGGLAGAAMTPRRGWDDTPKTAVSGKNLLLGAIMGAGALTGGAAGTVGALASQGAHPHIQPNHPQHVIHAPAARGEFPLGAAWLAGGALGGASAGMAGAAMTPRRTTQKIAWDGKVASCGASTAKPNEYKAKLKALADRRGEKVEMVPMPEKDAGLLGSTLGGTALGAAAPVVAGGLLGAGVGLGADALGMDHIPGLGALANPMAGAAAGGLVGATFAPMGAAVGSLAGAAHGLDHATRRKHNPADPTFASVN